MLGGQQRRAEGALEVEAAALSIIIQHLPTEEEPSVDPRFHALPVYLRQGDPTPGGHGARKAHRALNGEGVGADECEERSSPRAINRSPCLSGIDVGRLEQGEGEGTGKARFPQQRGHLLVAAGARERFDGLLRIFDEGDGDDVPALDAAAHGEDRGAGEATDIAVMEERTEIVEHGDEKALHTLEQACLANNAKFKDWTCTEDLMSLTKGGKALYMHCLPADITGVSCKAGEVEASVFDRYLVPLYKEASYKPYIIAAMIFLAKFKNPGAKLDQLMDKDKKRIR